MFNLDTDKLLHSLVYNPRDPLLFNSGFFLFFFAAFLLFYQFVYKRKLTRVLLFTLFSLYFFYKACGFYFLFIILSAVVDFNLSNFIDRAKSKGTKKMLLVFSITINLGLLFFFKYTDFFIGIYNDLSHGNIQPLKLVLPIGISFYTFENLSYTIDVYRGTFKPVKSFWDYCFFLSFFPKLVMGPIVRASDFVPQIRKEIVVTREDVATGLYLIVGGLFKKVISDYIFKNYVEMIFDDPARHCGLECLFGVYGYALVIYGDFSGYSDMAIGMAKWMGFNIPPNFDSPYQSTSITEFWRRWHISLSSWLKDYLYIPLGGNRKGKVRQYVNLFLTMLLGGFWHGARWNFIIWGALHGMALGIDKIRMEYFWKKNQTQPRPLYLFLQKALGLLITFHLVCFCWIFFKAETLDKALVFIHQIGTNFNAAAFLPLVDNYRLVFGVMLIGFFFHFLPKRIEVIWGNFFSVLPLAGRVIVLALVIWIVIQIRTAEAVPPIYLQF